jgi:hypothetical protein
LPDYFYAFFPTDEPERTLCVATSATGGLATAETVSGLPKSQISLRAIDREEFVRLAPAEYRLHFLKGTSPGYGMSA